MLGMWWVFYLATGAGGFALGFLLSLYFKIKRSQYVVKEFVTYGDLDLVATKVAQALRELAPFPSLGLGIPRHRLAPYAVGTTPPQSGCHLVTAHGAGS